MERSPNKTLLTVPVGSLNRLQYEMELYPDKMHYCTCVYMQFLVYGCYEKGLERWITHVKNVN